MREKREAITEYYIDHPNATAAEIAEATGVSNSYAFQVVSALNGKPKKRYSHRICDNMPECCFECPYNECIMSSAVPMTPDEQDFLSNSGVK